MSRANLIYNFERKIRNELWSVQADAINSDVIVRYHPQRIADGISLARQHKCLCTLKQLSRMLGKNFKDATKEDLVSVVAKIEQRQDFSAWTKRDYKLILKLYYQWLYGCEKGEYPLLVKWIRAGYHIPTALKKSDLLTDGEINKLARATTNVRDKALILVLAESGRRLGEILTLRIGDIEFDMLGAKFLVEGKMGQDYARVIKSARWLAKWLAKHPARKDPKAPVWIRLDRGEATQMSYANARSQLHSLRSAEGPPEKIRQLCYRWQSPTLCNLQFELYLNPFPSAHRT